MAVAELTPHDDSAPVRESRSLWAESLIRLRKNKAAMVSIVFIVLLGLSAVFANFVSPHDPIDQDLTANNAVPRWMLFILPENAENYANFSDNYPLAADNLGRDLLSRTLHGARISLSVAIVAATVSLIIGTTYGMISGYLGGGVDNAMMRVVDFLYGFPFLITVILLQAYFKALARRGGTEGIAGTVIGWNNDMGGLLFLFVAIGMLNWLAMSRIARGQVLSYKQKEFVEAAQAMGASDTRIVSKHLLPNIIGPLIVFETLAIPGYIFLEAFLSFIGLGVDAPTPSWGIMISEAIQGLRSYPNQVLVPAIFLSVTTLAFNFLGDGLRDAFDPRLKE